MQIGNSKNIINIKYVYFDGPEGYACSQNSVFKCKFFFFFRFLIINLSKIIYKCLTDLWPSSAHPTHVYDS